MNCIDNHFICEPLLTLKENMKLRIYGISTAVTWKAFENPYDGISDAET